MTGARIEGGPRDPSWEQEISMNETLFNQTLGVLNNSNETLARYRRFALAELNSTGNSSDQNESIEMSELLKNLEYLENDPNVAIKPSSGILGLLGADRGLI